MQTRIMAIVFICGGISTFAGDKTLNVISAELQIMNIAESTRNFGINFFMTG